MNFTGIKNYIIKNWKQILVISGISSFFLLIFLAVYISNKQLREAEKNSSGNLNKFNLIASWKGTNGEVVRSLTVDGTDIYAAAGYDGFLIFDSTSLNEKYVFTTNLCVNDIFVRSFITNKYAFLAVGAPDDMGGLLICDITDYTNIRVVNSSLTSNSIVNSLSIYSGKNDNGKLLNIFMTDTGKGFVHFSYDLSMNILALKDSGKGRNYKGIGVDSDNNAVFVISKNGFAFIYDWNGNLLSMISNSLSMINRVSIYGESLVVADRMGGLMLFNISDPHNCKYTASYYTSGDTYDIIENGINFYIADGINGVLKVKHEKGESFVLEKDYNDGAIYNKLYFSDSSNVLYAGCGKDGIRMLK